MPNEVTLIAPNSRMPLRSDTADNLGITVPQWKLLIDQVFPSAKSVDAVLLAFNYCRQRNLDVYKKPVHIVPMWNSQLRKMVETVWPGIAEVRTTATRTKEYGGIDAVEYGATIEKTFKGEVDQWVEENGTKSKKKEMISKPIRYPEWASVTVYRFVHGERCAFHAKVYWLEAYASIGKSGVPNDMWEKRPFGQIDKCVEAAALRKAFPEEIGNDYTADEMEGRTIESGGIVIEEPTRKTPPLPPAKDAQIEKRKDPPKPTGKPADDSKPSEGPTEPEKGQEASPVDDRLGETAQDTDYEEVTEVDEETVPVPGQILHGLRQAFTGVESQEEIDEIWEKHRIEEQLANHQDPDWFNMAKGLKAGAERKLA